MPEAQTIVAPTEKPLPHQVTARGDLARQIVDRIKASQHPAAVVPAPEAPKVTVSTDTETTEDAPAILSKQDPRYNDPQYWLKRGHTVNGMMAALRTQTDAELARKEQEIGKLSQQVADLQRQLSDATTKAASPTDYLSQEQIDLIGPEQASVIVSAVEKQIKEQVSKHISAVVEPMKKAQADDQAAKIKKANEEFFGAIRTAVPNFDKLNEDPGLIAFLGQVDPATGQTWAEIVRAAERRFDPKPCISVCKAYLKTLNVVDNREPVVEPTTVSGNASMPQGDANAGGDGEVMTRASIQSEYSRLAKTKASDAERAAFDAKVRKAQAEGRIR